MWKKSSPTLPLHIYGESYAQNTKVHLAYDKKTLPLSLILSNMWTP